MMEAEDGSLVFFSSEEFLAWLAPQDAESVSFPAPVPVFAVGPRVAILACLSESLVLRGYPPTIPEIAEAVGIGGPAVHRHLALLREAGYVTWEDGRQRTLRFCP